ncbi:MAG: hypothetical protein HUJ97_09035 [Bacteroidales bacterium]|nr:hypothetical protein [Bacteroidales bacterium]
MEIKFNVEKMYNSGMDLPQILSLLTDEVTKAYDRAQHKDKLTKAKAQAEEELYNKAQANVASGNFTYDDLVVLQNKLGKKETKKKETSSSLKGQTSLKDLLNDNNSPFNPVKRPETEKTPTSLKNSSKTETKTSKEETFTIPTFEEFLEEFTRAIGADLAKREGNGAKPRIKKDTFSFDLEKKLKEELEEFKKNGPHSFF